MSLFLIINDPQETGPGARGVTEKCEMCHKKREKNDDSDSDFKIETHTETDMEVILI